MSLSGIHFTQLLELIQSLPQGCQIVFNLFAIEGYSHKEIAEMLGISEGTSKSQFARAKEFVASQIIKRINVLRSIWRGENLKIHLRTLLKGRR